MTDYEKARAKVIEDNWITGTDGGDFLLDGLWLSPKWGCDTLTEYSNDLEALAEGKRQERERILAIITEMETKVTDNPFAIEALQSVKALISK